MTEQEEKLKKKIEKLIKRYKKKSRIIMYSNEIKNAKKLTEKLGYEAYYYKAKDRAKMARRFRGEKGRKKIKKTGEKKIIVATSIFETKIDVTNIRTIIYINRSRSVLKYK